MALETACIGAVIWEGGISEISLSTHNMVGEITTLADDPYGMNNACNLNTITVSFNLYDDDDAFTTSSKIKDGK